MIQIKLFAEKTPEMEKFEGKINAFLKENDGKMPEWMGRYITVDPKDTVEIKKETVKMK